MDSGFWLPGISVVACACCVFRVCVLMPSVVVGLPPLSLSPLGHLPGVLVPMGRDAEEMSHEERGLTRTNGV